MRLRTAVPLFLVLLAAASGCDLVSDPDGPRPEDFAVQEDASEVRGSEDEVAVARDPLQHDLASPLSTARGGVTLSITAPERAR